LPGYRGFLQPNTVTIAEVLRAAGYRTYLAGKWHLTQKSGPIQRGFDEAFAMIDGFRDFWNPKGYFRLPAGRPARAYPEGRFYSTDAFTDHALDFLADARKAGDKPFFLYLAYTAPHFPLHAPKDEIARYKDVYTKGWDRLREERFERMKQLGLIDPRWSLPPRSEFKGGAGNTNQGVNPAWDAIDADRRADLARRMAVYAAMVDRMDQNVGRVVADLRKHNELDNTLILFLSDNGACAEWDPWGFDVRSGPNNILHRGADLEKMGGPGTYHSYGSGWANACNTPLRLYKHYCHEGGISTPLIVHWPARVKAKGALRPQVGHVIDVMPTCAAVAGAAYPAERDGRRVTPMEGKSLVPAFDDEVLERPEHPLAWEHEGHRAIRVGRWKLVAKEGGPWELYDAVNDKVELNDLAAKDPAKVKDMAEQWEAWARRTNVLPRPGS
jgi:arylsulfatase